MYRKNLKMFYSEEDKKHIVVKEYSKLEKEEIQRKHKENRNRRRFVFSIILFSLVMCSFLLEERTQFMTYIAIIFMLFIIILFEFIDRVNKEAISQEYYFEIQVDRKLPKRNSYRRDVDARDSCYYILSD